MNSNSEDWIPGPQIFISYSRKNKKFVQKLVDALVAGKREVWLDDRNIELTAERLKRVFRNIEGSDNGVSATTRKRASFWIRR